MQCIIIDSSYQGHDVVRNVQLVQCNTTGRIFGLSSERDIEYIYHDSNEEGIKSSLESLNNICLVTIIFNQGTKFICVGKKEAVLLISIR